MDTTPAAHDEACETREGHLASGHYCCDTFAVDHVWGTEQGLAALHEVDRLHSGLHQCRGGIYDDDDPDYRGAIATRGACPTAAAARAGLAARSQRPVLIERDHPANGSCLNDDGSACGHASDCATHNAPAGPCDCPRSRPEGPTLCNAYYTDGPHPSDACGLPADHWPAPHSWEAAQRPEDDEPWCSNCQDSHRVDVSCSANARTYADQRPEGAEADIKAIYHETAFDRVVEDDDGRVYIYGLPYRAEHDGLRAAATSPEGARAMIRSMLERRAAHAEASGAAATERRQGVDMTWRVAAAAAERRAANAEAEARVLRSTLRLAHEAIGDALRGLS